MRAGDNAAMSQEAVYPSLEERVVLVTGGASGIGAAMVEAFARQRARVVFLDVQDDAAQRLVERMEGVGFPAPIYFRCDLTDFAALERAVREVLRRFGGVDVLVNNAGNDTRHAVESVTPESWDATMAINLKQQFFMAQAVAPSMRSGEAGIDREHGVDCVGDSFEECSGVCDGEGGDCGDDASAGARVWRGWGAGELRDAGSDPDRASEAAVGYSRV